MLASALLGSCHPGRGYGSVPVGQIRAAMLLLLQSTRLGVLLHERISDRPRRRLFVATVSLFLTFAGVRGIVYCITHQIPPPFHFVVMERRHIHHFVFGIPMLLAVGYAWLAEIGVGVGPSSLLASRLFSILYGVGAALTLDEFALWPDCATFTGRLKVAPANRRRHLVRSVADSGAMGCSTIFVEKKAGKS
jgi:hypothetical protein